MYVKELEPISDFSKEFLDKLNIFLINSNLSDEQRSKLVEIINSNFCGGCCSGGK